MLYSIDSSKYVKSLPHYREFEMWRKKISDEDYEKIVDEIHLLTDSNEINTSGWLPGRNWDGTVFEPIYYACNKSEQHSGMFFGLIVFETLMNDPSKVWGFGRFEINGIAIKSMTYFLIENPPKE